MKKTGIFISVYTLLTIFFLNGCEEINDLYSDNQKITKEIPLDHYNNVWTWGVFDMVVVEDTTCKVIVTGKKSVVENINFSQKGRKLLVEEEKTNQWYRGTDKPVLEFHFKNLRYFRIEEPSRLTSPDTIHSAELQIIGATELAEVDLTIDVGSFYMENWTTNTGEYKLSGSCEKFHVKLFGSGKLHAHNLNTLHAHIEQHSIANGYISVKDTLEVYSSGKGNIYYEGNPEKIIFEQHASGKLIRMD